MKKTNFYYSPKLEQFNKFSHRLNKMIDNGTFYRLSTQKRNMLICRLKRLYNQLLGFIPEFKLKHILAAAAALVLSIGAGTSYAQTFGPPQINPFGLTSVIGYAFPSFVDIDGDGDFDAFVVEGSGPSSAIKYFENTGTNISPAFAAPQTNPFGLDSVAGYLAAPSFVDIDGDGDFDAFVSREWGYGGVLTYFANMGTNTAPVFAAPQINPFGLVDTVYYATPAFVDIDSDGDFDLFVGEYYGSLKYFQNTGSNTAPAFAAQQTNPFGLDSVAGYIAAPDFVDIDGDGDFDAFVGGEYYGTLTYFENTGTNIAPAFAVPQANPFGLTVLAYLAAPDFVDIDGDGDFDLFIGEYGGAIKYFENTTTPNCPSPIYLTAANATQTTADLSWTSTNAGAAYTIEYGPVGFILGTGTTLTGISIAGANTQSISGLTPTTLYDFYIQEDCGAGNFSANVGPLLFGPSPVNDGCSGAIALACGDIINYTTVVASPDSVLSCGTGNGTGGGVWFSFTGTGDTINASLCGSTYDTKIRVYTGACGALVCETGIDDFCGLQSEVSWLSTPGVTYYILVHGWDNSEGFFTLNMCNTVGIKENDIEANIVIYPNPANETFNISIQGKNESEDMTLEIMNSIGQIMLKEQIEVSKEINTADFVKGLYFIKLSSKNSIITRKLIVL